jgi:peptidyl-prolyl cis-trans isomerase C
LTPTKPRRKARGVPDEATPVAVPDEAVPAPAAETVKPLAVVNGREIPALYGELVKREMAQGQPDSPQLDARVRESLINLELLSRAAVDKGLDRDPRLAAIARHPPQGSTGQGLSGRLRQSPSGDRRGNPGRLRQGQGRTGRAGIPRAPHSGETEAEAKKIIADLGKKAKFEDLAKKHSKDPGSAKNGGALDWSDRGAFVPEFSDAWPA